MIVRIATEGQFELDQADYEAVNDLDNRCVEAVEAGDEARFKELTSASAVDDELTKMRAELGSGSGAEKPAGELGQGSGQ